MKWPERPTCHDEGFPRVPEHCVWRPPRLQADGPYAYPFRTCGYCGSMHPEDLAKFLQDGVVGLDGSDWKYGWPHKFYVEGIPNPLAGQTVQVGGESGPGYSRPIMGEARPFTHAKWYNKHLEDQGYDDEARDLLLKLLSEHSGITWNHDPDKGIGYKAPYRGYQHESEQSKRQFEEVKKSLNL